MNDSIYLQTYFITGDNGNDFPINKALLDDGWFCRLISGSISVNFNHKEYSISNNDGEETYFLVNEGMFFSIKAGSNDFQLQIISISHNCLTSAYPYLGSEVIAQITYSQLITTQQINSPIKEMFIASFLQLEQLECNSNNLLDFNEMTSNFIVYTLHIFRNAIAQWRDKQGLHVTDRLGIESQTQSYQIMNKLSQIFDEPESLHHREVQYYANRLNISVRYFFNVCKNETGMTPKDFINDIIISDIKHTLLTTNLSLQQMTIKYAFSDASAFTQYFKRNTGMTPSDFRNQQRR